MSCALEINSNGKFKQGHAESFPLTKKKNIFFTTMPVATKLRSVVTYHEGVPPIKSHALIIWSCKMT